MSHSSLTEETDSEPPAVETAVRPVSEPQVNTNTPEGESTPSRAASATSNDVAVLWLRRGDMIAVWLLVTALLVLLGVHWMRLSRWGTAPIELSSQQPREYYYSLDINSASWVEWAQLEGLGETLARRIVADRDERGPFRDPADVGRVRGIGPKLLEKIKPFLHGGTAATNGEPGP